MLIISSFDGGECGEETHEVCTDLGTLHDGITLTAIQQSLRLTFHDAIGFSPKLFLEGKFGYARVSA